MNDSVSTLTRQASGAPTNLKRGKKKINKLLNKKENREPKHVCLYTKSLSAFTSTHPTYDAELLRPLDHQTEDAPNRLVGQIEEVGRGDSWGAVGTLLKGTST